MAGSSREPKSILRARQPVCIRPLSKELSRRIPSEVIDLIIERVACFDVPTLAVCSLVCKTWLKASRQRLFSAISLSQRNTKSFIRLVDSPHATISWGIRHVSIQHSSFIISHHRLTPDKLRFAEESDAAHVAEDRCPESALTLRCDEALLRRLTTFKSLTSLCFSWIQGGLDAQATGTLARGFPGLTDLEFRACAFPSFPQFTDTVCALQSLQRLALSDVAWKDTRLPGDNEPPSKWKCQRLPRGLRTVELYIAPIGHVVTWLGSYSSELAELETVRLCSVFWEDVDVLAISWFLKRFAGKIRHLSLPWHLPEVNLSRLTELRSLHLSHLWFQPCEPEVDECFTPHGIEKTLIQLSSPRIEIVQFSIQWNETALLLQFDWDKISEILTRKSFARLRDVTFGMPVYDRKLRAMLKKIRGVPSRQSSTQRRSLSMSRSPRKQSQSVPLCFA